MEADFVSLQLKSIIGWNEDVFANYLRTGGKR